MDNGSLKAGETVYQVGELPETLRVSKIHYEPPKTVFETPFASIFPPTIEDGDGTRYSERVRTTAAALTPAERKAVEDRMLLYEVTGESARGLAVTIQEEDTDSAL